MEIKTDRLVLRPWRLSDAGSLYKYASDERVGPVAGWPPHQSVEESEEIIRTIFMQDGVFALTLKDDDRAIGCVGVVRGAKSNLPIGEDEAEISYWIGTPYWGMGLVPEAVMAVIEYAFVTLGVRTLWCGYFDGNDKSRRVQEKCGFRHHHTCAPAYFPLTDDVRVEHISILERP